MQALKRFLHDTQISWQHSDVIKWSYICLGIFFMLFLAGVLYGWSSLLVVLYSSGVYAELCTNGTSTTPQVGSTTAHYINTIANTMLSRQRFESSIDSSASSPVNGTAPVIEGSMALCVEQELRLNFAYVCGIGSFMVAGPFTGSLMDWQGSRFAFGAWSSTVLLGSILFAFGSHTAVFDALIPACILIGFGTAGVLVSLYPIAKMKIEYLSMVFALLSSAFDSSTSVFYAYMMIYKATGLAVKTFFLIYSIVPFLGIIVSLFLWPRGVGEPEHHKASKNVDKFNGNSEHTNGIENGTSSASASPSPSPSPQSNGDSHEIKLDLEKANDGTDVDYVDDSPKTSQFGSPHLFHVPFIEQLKSREWIFFTIYLSCYTFWLNAYFGSAQARLQAFDPNHLHDKEILTMVEVLGICLAAAFISAPIVGFIIQKLGLELSVLMMAILGTLWTGIQFVPNIPVQIVTFVTFAVFRAYFYSIGINILSNLVGWVHIGKAYGLTGFVAGPISFLYTPLVWAVYNKWGGSFTIPTILEMICLSVGFLFYFYLRQRRISYVFSGDSNDEELENGEHLSNGKLHSSSNSVQMDQLGSKLHVEDDHQNNLHSNFNESNKEEDTVQLDFDALSDTPFDSSVVTTPSPDGSSSHNREQDSLDF